MTKHIRPIRVEGNIAYVPLTKGYEAIIDAADVPLVSGVNWHATTSNGRPYAIHSIVGGVYTKPSMRQMHRIIFGSLPSDKFIDHIDCDSLNNRRENLRPATHAQNCRNRKVPTTNTSGLKGAIWMPKLKKWRAKIDYDGEKIHLGYFGTPEAAHAAYCKASSELHREFGRTK